MGASPFTGGLRKVTASRLWGDDAFWVIAAILPVLIGELRDFSRK